MPIEKQRSEYGFTLIEVLVSLSILGVMVVCYLSLYTTSFINAYSMGRHTDVMATASAQMEVLTANEPLTFNGIRDVLGTVDLKGNHVVDKAHMYVYHSNTDFNFHLDPVSMNPHLETKIDGYVVTIVVPYNGGERNVTLTSFIKGDFINE